MLSCTRFERYARWKANRLPLHRIPDDVFSYIAERLNPMDLSSLLEAYLGVKPDLSSRKAHSAMPAALCAVWTSKMAVHQFSEFLKSLSERSMYHCRGVTSVIALVDWSCFSAKPVCPVAEYGWVYPTAKVVVHEDRLYGHLISCFQRKLPCIRVTLHTHIGMSQANIVNPTPLLWLTYPVLPYFVLY